AGDAEAFRKRLAAGGYQALIKRQPLNEVAGRQPRPEPAQTSATPASPTPAADAAQPEPGTIR
ncbi:MAG: hypothetical protein ACRD3I_04565, partial [Terriglobales bacterium]